MKIIETHGISYLEPLDGSGEWYWGNDYIHGDLYEAEELYRDHHPVQCNRLVFVHAPDGRVAEPVKGKAGQYFGRPIFFGGRIQILLADFPQAMVRVLEYDDALDQVSEAVSLPLTAVEDCYNLLLRRSPLMLTRQGHDGRLQIIWPEQAEFPIGETESFIGRRGQKLYFSRWYDEPEYREEVAVRSYPAGELLEVISGTWMDLPDGQSWVLR